MDAMTHLLLAYRAFLDDKRCWPLLDPLMDIIERKRDLITDGGMDLEVVEEEVDYEKAVMKTEDGIKYPARAFAYTPDKESPSTWKLRLWDSPSEKETASQIGAAVAALGKGFRGNRVKIPADDMPAVKKKVLAAWLRVHPDETRDDAPSVLKAVVYEDVTKKIVKNGEEWCVFSADGGENYGCYSTEAAAKERLGEIEYFANKNLSGRTTSELRSLLGRIGKVQNTDAAALEAIVRNEISTRDNYVCKADEERRYTLGPVYVPGQIDAHGEFTDDATLQKALWGWVKKGDRSIRLQHTDKAAGEMVELVTWPWEITTKMSVPGDKERDVQFPAETPFMGVVWEPWAWDLVKAGELRGYSMGGRARRVEAEFASAV